MKSIIGTGLLLMIFTGGVLAEETSESEVVEQKCEMKTLDTGEIVSHCPDGSYSVFSPKDKTITYCTPENAGSCVTTDIKK